MNQKEIKELIELISSHQIAEFEMEGAGFKLRIRTSASAQLLNESTTFSTKTPFEPQPLVSTNTLLIEQGKTESTQTQESNLHIITAPIVGTFYRAPSPTSQSFVEVGSIVKSGTVLCIVEAMKLMNEIESDISGEVVEIYQENGKPVEYGQPLFGIKLANM